MMRRFLSAAATTRHRAASPSLLQLLDPDTMLPLAVSSAKQINPASPLSTVRAALLAHARTLDPEISMPPHPAAKKHVKRTQGLQNVEHVICVASGKGGVGKSTIAANLACSFAQLGARTGLFDADVHGPSLPTMMVPRDGGTWKVTKSPEGLVSPVVLHGVTCMSFGFVGPGTGGRGARRGKADLSNVRGPVAAMLRGPMASKTIEELCASTDWGELDVLVVDLPPGTGDVHLALCQRLAFDGAVVVTTPQELSFVDVARGIDMLEALKVPAVAAVENMSWFTCDHGKRHLPFGEGHLERLRQAYGIRHSLSLPILQAASAAGDSGVPLVCGGGDSGQAQSATAVREAKAVYLALAACVSREMVCRAEFGPGVRPSVWFDPARNLVMARFFDAGKATQLSLPPLELRRRLSAVDRMMGLDLAALPPDLAPVEIAPKGNYAVTIKWSNGHDASIYSFDAIRQAAEDFATDKAAV